MGNRRLSRKRLYQVEKAGQSVNLESGAGATGMIKSVSQHRQGQELITEIAIDLQGDSDTTIVGGGANNQVIGVSGKKAMITRLTKAKYGTITEVRGVIVEASAANVNIVVGSDSVDTGSSPTGVTELVAAIGTDLGEDTSALAASIIAIDSNGMQTADNEWYLYIANDGHAGSGTLAAGKILIYLHGFAAPDDL